MCSNFLAVSSRFWGAGSKSDECQTGTLEHFRQNPKIQDGCPPAVGETVKNIKVADLHNLGIDSYVLWHSKTVSTDHLLYGRPASQGVRPQVT